MSSVHPTDRSESPSHLRLVSASEAVLDESDAELAARCAQHDRAAAAEFWRRHSPRVRRILMRALGGDVEDLTQEVFITFFRRSGALREFRAARAYLYSIAVNTIRHEIRRRAWQRLLPWQRTDADVEGVAPAEVAMSPAAERLSVLLDELGPETRLLFVLRYSEGLELKELATALGVSLATAKRKLSRATERLLAAANRDPILKHARP